MGGKKIKEMGQQSQQEFGSEELGKKVKNVQNVR